MGYNGAAREWELGYALMELEGECQRLRKQVVGLQASLRDAEHLLLRQGEVLAENERLREQIAALERELAICCEANEGVLQAEMEARVLFLAAKARVQQVEAVLRQALGDSERETS